MLLSTALGSGPRNEAPITDEGPITNEGPLTDTATVIRVRRAVAADAPEVVRVHVRSWQWAYRGLLAQDYLDGLDPQGWTARFRVVGLIDGPAGVNSPE
ncbi:hypothetical protein X011_24520 [Mycobacterium tuberculosis variant microti OV254]|nr:hypothetical protein X011_24520 [Mycobacterium tuberculosis variant microti OV254]